MKTLILSILALVLNGCAALGATGMTPPQLKEFAKDDSATGFCNQTTVTTVQTTTTYGRVDKGTRQNLTIGQDCSQSFTDTTPQIGKVTAP